MKGAMCSFAACRRTALLTFLLTAAVALALAGPASAKEKIKWVTMDWPPVHITKGPEVDKGSHDFLQSKLIELMPGYDHETELLPMNRIMEKAGEGENLIMTAGTYGLEGVPFIDSIPFLALPPLQIIVRTADLDRFGVGADKTLSLEKLLQNDGFKMGHTVGREYYTTLQTLVTKYPQNIIARSVGSDITGGVLAMLKAGRFDYLLEYDFLVRYSLAEMGLPPDEFTAISTTELGVADWELQSVWLTKNEWGNTVVKDLNQALAQVMKTDEFRAQMARWFASKDKEKEFWEINEKLLKAASN